MSIPKRALITGIAGWRPADIYHDCHKQDVRLTLHYRDITDVISLASILSKVQPEEVLLNTKRQIHASNDCPKEVQFEATLSEGDCNKRLCTPNSKFLIS